MSNIPNIFIAPRMSGFSKLKYYLSQLKINWNDWRWYYFQFTNHILPLLHRKRSNGIYIMEQKWDNLIILDACRYDVFKKHIGYLEAQGELKKVASRGSSTVEFLKENFLGRRFPDTVYVTANPYVSIMLKDAFYKVIDVWLEGWDDALGTVPPDIVTAMAIEAKELYPDKRLIVHYMQPHSPFIGEYRVEGNFWQVALKYGAKVAMKAYESNLKLVLSYVKYLIRVLNGKTVITSDHGNACGERVTFLRIPIYGHPTGIHIPALIEVPWFIVETPYEGARMSIDPVRIRLKYKIRNLRKKQILMRY